MPKKILSFSLANSYVKDLGGDDAVSMVGILVKKSNVTDEVIGKRMKHLKITEIRTLLNKLHFKGIVHYQKTRDTKSGWYSYTWELKPKRIAELILEERSEEIEKLEKKMNYEMEHDFFTCKKECDHVAFEIAAEYLFKCPICGESMDLIDYEKKRKDISSTVDMLKKEMKGLEIFISTRK
jgi:transcription initiation factor TFIIE subunit alpha